MEILTTWRTCTMTIEGTLAVAPDGRLLSTMRFGGDGKAIVYEVDTEDPDAPLKYSHCIEFPANRSKFMFKQDPVTKRYYSIASRITDPEKKNARNVLSLLRSDDLIDYSDRNHLDFGFQYVDFFMEGEDILYLCRTAINGACNYHDSNYSTFHRIKNFREL